jgi:ribonuclease-3 family protein
MMDFFETELTKTEIDNLSSLALAHIGDAVFELLVRGRVISKKKAMVGKLHAETIKLVNARAQAEFARLLLPELTDEEASVYKRGRNSRVNSVPKNMSVADYHAATGLEALFGWLWLIGYKERINELFGIIDARLN